MANNTQKKKKKKKTHLSSVFFHGIFCKLQSFSEPDVFPRFTQRHEVSRHSIIFTRVRTFKTGLYQDIKSIEHQSSVSVLWSYLYNYSPIEGSLQGIQSRLLSKYYQLIYCNQINHSGIDKTRFTAHFLQQKLIFISILTSLLRPQTLR